MVFECGRYNVSIYGDGMDEYDNYYLVILDEFDKFDNPTQRKKVLYVKSVWLENVEEFIKHIINNELVEALPDNGKIAIRKTWEMVVI